MKNKIHAATHKKSQENNRTDILANYETASKLVLPKLSQSKKVGSMPTYSQLNSGQSNKFDSRINIDEEFQYTRLKLNFPKISAKSYLIYEIQKQSVMKAHNHKSRRQIASLTKLMTAICSIEISQKYNLLFRQTFFRITKTATDVKGTLASLQPFEWINLHDLLYGLMLPSGNDAANVLAENLGAILYFDKIGERQILKQIKSIDLTEDDSNIPIYIEEFIAYMNEMAEKIDMKNSMFSNPHGLDHKHNYATCQDLIKLSLYCCENEYFNKVVTTKTHRAEVRLYRNKLLYKKAIYWENTNKLLSKVGCKGLKTGYTPLAGGCLITLYETTNSQNLSSTVLIIVLGCKSQQHRFSDTQETIQWLLSHNVYSEQSIRI